MTSAIQCKLVVVGDGAVGKTCLYIVYASKTFPVDYIPTVFDSYVARIVVDHQTVDIGFWDTAGQEEYDRLRPLSYPYTDVFFLCYSVNSRTSFENISTKWVPEVTLHCPNVPYILVGTKTDLRDEQEPFGQTLNETVSFEEGEAKARKIRAAAFLECSSLRQIGINELFEGAARCKCTPPAYRTKPKRRSQCSIM